jgi:hypothetical protein
MNQLSVPARRAFITVALLLAFACLSNYWFEWRLFGGFDRPAAVFGFVVLAFVLHFFPISLEELRGYRDERKAGVTGRRDA